MKTSTLVLSYILIALPGDAHAKGGGGLLIVLLILFAPALIYLMKLWMALSLSLMPIAIGLYFVFAARGMPGVLIGLVLIVLGGLFTWIAVTQEQKDKIRDFFTNI